MLGESHRLDRLVGDLLDLARLGAEDFRIDLRPVDLAALVGDRPATVWRARCAADGVGRAGPTCRAPAARAGTDPTRVRQIVDGLAENALRVTPAGAPDRAAACVTSAPGTAVARRCATAARA